VTYETTIPYGDQVLTLVTSPSRHLGAPVSQWLPLILLASGILLTALAVVVTSQLVRGRREAERHTATITALYERVDSLYEEQRALFVRLQRALLPQTNPLIPRLEIASEYVAGTQGIDIGGDWYSVIGISDDEFAFVVGDVSGRGVDAVAVMAHARFTIRAYLVEGHSPSVALEKCSHQFDISADGHITTALVGVGNWRTGRVTIANAGHPLPLMLADSGTTYIGMPVGPPLGVGPATYDSMTFDLPLGTCLLLYTDGLIERRTEDIGIGMDRLAETAHPLAREPLALLLTEILAALRDDDASDDIAMLALRRVAT
jgi:serine phosphatase RsbU (regulator of sigma subunit)